MLSCTSIRHPSCGVADPATNYFEYRGSVGVWQLIAVQMIMGSIIRSCVVETTVGRGHAVEEWLGAIALAGLEEEPEDEVLSLGGVQREIMQWGTFKRKCCVVTRRRSYENDFRSD
ncbi:hypothetical protein Q1695_006610 [Nippostrongylus brasiliensis]|nr:hypothetical protein Q1695_006610 [Nippostrongylus brasiliensis]